MVARYRRLGEMLAPELCQRATQISELTYEVEGFTTETYQRVAPVQEYSEFAKRVRSADEAISRAVKRRNNTLRDMDKRHAELAKLARLSIAKADDMLAKPSVRRAQIREDVLAELSTGKKN